MPPSRPSSSSHSSHSSSHSSHSSSSRSSFGSSSSRSSFSSSSSRSSGSSYSGGSFGTFSGPSRKSTSSHSSSSFGGYRPSASSGPKKVSPTMRPRVNQPKFSWNVIAPVVRTCSNHDYYYFPNSWEYDGTTYSAGYYDENGTRYDNVAFKENGKNTVEMVCEYCDNRVKLEWNDGEMPVCSHCGAPLSLLQNIQTDTVREPQYDTSSSSSYAQRGGNSGGLFGFFKRHKIITGILALSLIGQILQVAGYRSIPDSEYTGTGSTYISQSDFSAPFGYTMYLSEAGDGIYDISDINDYSKALDYDSEYNTYYDPDSDAYLMYNNNVDPPLWQYWFEGYSSSYGDYGWMECEGKTWYVEKSEDVWVKYPGKTSTFWHIRNSFD